MQSVENLVDALRMTVEVSPEKIAFHFLRADGKAEWLTYSQLLSSALSLGEQLKAFLGPGDRAVLCYPPGLEFIKAFFGVLCAGAIAVPVALPGARRGEALCEILAAAQPAVFLTQAASLVQIRKILGSVNGGSIGIDRIVATDDFLPTQNTGSFPCLSGHAPCVLQFTSGSTIDPRGVTLSHHNVLASAIAMAEATDLTPESSGVSWLPHFHDMGLFGGIVTPVVVGFSVALMAPTTFSLRPVRWLQAISDYRATVSIAPNSAYDLCTKLISSDDLSTISLASWKIAGCGAEPVSAATLAAFTVRFSAYNFDSRALYPCYGLAEATLMISGGPAYAGVKTAEVSATGLRQHRLAAPLSPSDTQAIVSSGHVLPGLKAIVVDPVSSTPVGTACVGEIWVSGDSIGNGYWGNEDATEQVFRALTNGGAGPYLRTGDLGFLEKGELYITGRIKDLIIVQGRNFYPQDIESVAQNSSADVMRTIAFGILEDEVETVGIAIDLVRAPSASPGDICLAIYRKCLEALDLEVSRIWLVAPGTLPTTSSGKPQRSLCRSSILSGSLSTRLCWQPSPIGGPIAPDTGDWLITFFLPFVRADERTRLALAQSFLLDAISKVSGRSLDSIDQYSNIFDLGLSSIQLAILKNKIEADLVISISPQIFWNNPTAEQLSVQVYRAFLHSPLLQDGGHILAIEREVMAMSAGEVAEALASDGRDVVPMQRRLDEIS